METIDFEKMQGLAPAVVQDADNGEVLMVGFMNREALDKTLRSGYVTFYSRTRNQLWTKGETSGNRLRLICGLHRLRSRHCAVPGARGRRWTGLPRRHALVLYQAYVI